MIHVGHATIALSSDLRYLASTVGLFFTLYRGGGDGSRRRGTLIVLAGVVRGFFGLLFLHSLYVQSFHEGVVILVASSLLFSSVQLSAGMLFLGRLDDWVL